MMKLTDGATGRTVEMKRGSKRGTTLVVTFDPTTGVKAEHEFPRKVARAHFADLHVNKGWR